MQKRLATTATAAGVNGDYFTFATGRPSGILLRDGQLVTPPNAGRASVGVDDGRHPRRAPRVVRRLVARAHRDPDRARAERAAGRRRLRALHRRLRGRRRRRSRGASPSCSSRSRPRPPRSISSRPCSRSALDGGSVAIPPGGAVLVARGALGDGARPRRPRRHVDDGAAHAPARRGPACSRRSAAGRSSSGTARRSTARGRSSARSSSSRARRGARWASSPTGGSCSSRSTAASPGTASA